MALLLLAVASPGQAQQASSTVLREATGEVMVEPFDKSSTELEDMNLLSHTGEEIGEIERVLVDEDGRPAAVTAEVGGFLGVGQKTVVIGLDRLRLEGEDEPDLATTLTKKATERSNPFRTRAARASDRASDLAVKGVPRLTAASIRRVSTGSLLVPTPKSVGRSSNRSQ